MDSDAKPARLLTSDEIAALAGVSKRTIDRWAEAGQIPFIQPAGKGGSKRFPPDALDPRPASTEPVAPPPAAATAQRSQARRSGPRPRWTQGPRS